MQLGRALGGEEALTPWRELSLRVELNQAQPRITSAQRKVQSVLLVERVLAVSMCHDHGNGNGKGMIWGFLEH